MKDFDSLSVEEKDLYIKYMSEKSSAKWPKGSEIPLADIAEDLTKESTFAGPVE
ncbi:hypothetical protein [Mucilaginibacter sp. SP1R1]|uniref:hypothetical protein n=1 Tax=Mucilaginibacter sp. SP1R1 TaxID=2723091 RepID=UPI001611B6ED|nr:hypothetical protein [Mucilaginibacter sp. SP1R1]MBB6149504.1 hypothetical protein [Mucilaginibacter sp. SP1R1]